MANAIQKSQQKELKTLLFDRVDEFTHALAGRADAESFLRVAYTSVTKNTSLAECTTPSILMGVLEAASLGLQLHGAMGEAYLVSYKANVEGEWQKLAQLQVGYRGLVKLARRSGMIRTVVPRVVYAGEHFEVEYGTNERIEHTPNLDGTTNEKDITHVYAVAHFTDGTVQFEVMNRKQVEEIKARSKSKKQNGEVFGPWVTDYTEMALKTVVRRLCKRLPLSDMDLARALEIDNEGYDLDGTASAAPAPKKGAAALNHLLKQKQQRQAEEIEDAEFEVVGETAEATAA